MQLGTTDNFQAFLCNQQLLQRVASPYTALLRSDSQAIVCTDIEKAEIHALRCVYEIDVDICLLITSPRVAPVYLFPLILRAQSTCRWVFSKTEVLLPPYLR